MPAAFLHGIETIESSIGAVPVQIVRSAVVGLIGTAPQWAVLGADKVNQPTLVSSAFDARQFGPKIRGYTIPYAIDAIQNLGAGQIIVIDVFDPTKHFTDIVGTFALPSANGFTLGHMGVSNVSVRPTAVTPVVGESLTMVGTPGTVEVAHGNLAPASVVVQNAIGSVTYVENTDYTVNYRTGLITRIATGTITLNQQLMVGYSWYSGTPYALNTDYTVDAVNGVVNRLPGGTIPALASVMVGFSYADPSKVTDTDIIGAASGFTGLHGYETTYGTMGFFAKLIIAPGYSDRAGVAQQMLAEANKIRAMALIDSPPGISVATAISNRGLAGNSFDTSDERAILCYPYQVFFDTGLIATGATVDINGVAVTVAVNANAVGPYSQWVAGAICKRDVEKGYWWSPSNMELVTALGPDIVMYMSPVDPNADSNNLNAAGIVTVLNSFGTGIRVWGNRSSAWPSKSAPVNFIPIRRTMDILEESMMEAMLQFLDQPISNGLITTILQSTNSFIRTLIQRGALVGGFAFYDPAANPATEIALGHLTFNIDVMPPPPAERLTFDVAIDTSLLSIIGNTTASAVSA